MAAVARLVTLVDIEDDDPGASRTSASACHEALLVDGRRVLPRDDRGWSSSGNVPDIWAVPSVEDIERTARAVVGPDEPLGGRSQEDMEAAHWAYLSEVLRWQGVVAEARELKRLPHVVLSKRLLARVGRDDLSP